MMVRGLEKPTASNCAVRKRIWQYRKGCWYALKCDGPERQGNFEKNRINVKQGRLEQPWKKHDAFLLKRGNKEMEKMNGQCDVSYPQNDEECLRIFRALPRLTWFIQMVTLC